MQEKNGNFSNIVDDDKDITGIHSMLMLTSTINTDRQRQSKAFPSNDANNFEIQMNKPNFCMKSCETLEY